MCEAIQAGHAQIENTQVGADDDTFQFQQRQQPLSKANIRPSEMRMGNSSDLEKEKGSCPITLPHDLTPLCLGVRR
jgi:hypothetical protein